MRITTGQFDSRMAICRHIQLLGHDGLGVTELRVLDPTPMVAYAETINDVVRLADEMDAKAAGIYVGVQPRSVDMLDHARNCWRLAVENGESNCACAKDIEYISAVFFDIDVVCPQRQKGHPASDNELAQSLQAAHLLAKQIGLALSSTICCSGNGHYVLAPTVPIAVDSDEVAAQFKQFCQQLASDIMTQVSGVRIDPVYDLSRIMRLMGTVNRKGAQIPDRPHRRAHFVTEPLPAMSQALHYMILDTESEVQRTSNNTSSPAIRCDVTKIESCDFIRWCREHPLEVAEPLWFAMITNLAHLEGGPDIVHEISRLDKLRYAYQQTQRLIERVQNRSYSPVSCATIRSSGFDCRKFGQCQAKAPMYLTDLFSIWNKTP